MILKRLVAFNDGNLVILGQILVFQFSTCYPSELNRCTTTLTTLSICSHLLFETLLAAVWMFAAALKASAGFETRSTAVLFYQMQEAAFPQTLTCLVPHCDSYLGSACASVSLLAFSFHFFLVSLCPTTFSHALRKPKLVPRRRNTCPSAQDISRALQSPSSASSASAASLDELIQRCLNCFGQSPPRPQLPTPTSTHVSPEFVMCLCSFIATRLYK